MVLKYILDIVSADVNAIPDFTACGSRVLSTSGEFVEVLNFREDNEESSEEYCIWYEETHSDRIIIFYSIE